MINKRFPICSCSKPLHRLQSYLHRCGRIREYESTSRRIPLEECLAALMSAAPMVSICGGEPMMYPQIGELVAGILEAIEHLRAPTAVHREAPAPNAHPTSDSFFNVHLDGSRRRTTSAWKKTVSPQAIEGSRLQAGRFMVWHHTTVYKETT